MDTIATRSDYDPIGQFIRWLEAAKAHPEIKEPTAMSVATANEQGEPHVRILLLKEVDETGFVFYGNLLSKKGLDLKYNPRAALCFYWHPLGRQVRVEGDVNPVAPAEADAYFKSRPRGSQIGAWVSQQSEPLDSRKTLTDKISQLEHVYEDVDVPRPQHWSGWRLKPKAIEFWTEGEFRLHERELYKKISASWSRTLLYP